MNTNTDRRVAVIGLGAMGGAMAATLHRAGWDVTGFDPFDGARAAAADAGIKTTASLEDVAGTPYAVLSLPAASIVETTVPQLLAAPGNRRDHRHHHLRAGHQQAHGRTRRSPGSSLRGRPGLRRPRRRSDGFAERLRRRNRRRPRSCRAGPARPHRRQVQPHRRPRQRQRGQAPQQRPGGGQPGLRGRGPRRRQGLRHRSRHGRGQHQRSLRRQQSLRQHVPQLGPQRHARFRLLPRPDGTRRRPRRGGRRADRRKTGAARRRRRPVAGRPGRPRTARRLHRNRPDRGPGHHARRRPRQRTPAA